MKYFLTFAIGVLLIAFINSCYAGKTDYLHSLLQHTLSEWQKNAGVPGVQMTVMIPGRPVMNFHSGTLKRFSQGYHRNVRNGSLFEVGSITKSFTAVAILKLEAQGKLNINETLEEIHRQYASFPNYKKWKNVTIRQLLNMTSGIEGFFTDAFQAEIEAHAQKHWTLRQLINPVYQSAPNSFKDCVKGNTWCFYPGTGWYYSNTNYLLLGQIIQAVTGTTPRFFSKNILLVQLLNWQ